MDKVFDMEKFVFFDRYYSTISILGQADKRVISLAIMEYMFEGKEPKKLSSKASYAWFLIFPSLQLSKTNYNNGSRRYQPKKSDENTTKTESKTEQKLNQNYNQNNTENDIIFESDFMSEWADIKQLNTESAACENASENENPHPASQPAYINKDIKSKDIKSKEVKDKDIKEREKEVYYRILDYNQKERASYQAFFEGEDYKALCNLVNRGDIIKTQETVNGKVLNFYTASEYCQRMIDKRKESSDLQKKTRDINTILSAYNPKGYYGDWVKSIDYQGLREELSRLGVKEEQIKGLFYAYTQTYPAA